MRSVQVFSRVAGACLFVTLPGVPSNCAQEFRAGLTERATVQYGPDLSDVTLTATDVASAKTYINKTPTEAVSGKSHPPMNSKSGDSAYAGAGTSAAACS